MGAGGPAEGHWPHRLGAGKRRSRRGLGVLPEGPSLSPRTISHHPYPRASTPSWHPGTGPEGTCGAQAPTPCPGSRQSARPQLTPLKASFSHSPQGCGGGGGGGGGGRAASPPGRHRVCQPSGESVWARSIGAQTGERRLECEKETSTWKFKTFPR